jgi:hypothetical protein
MLFLVWLFLALVVLGAATLVWGWLPYLVAGLCAAVFLVWVLASVLSPAVPDRTCPACKGEGLVKIRRGELGVRCELCGFRDENMHVAYLDEW